MTVVHQMSRPMNLMGWLLALMLCAGALATLLSFKVKEVTPTPVQVVPVQAVSKRLAEIDRSLRELSKKRDLACRFAPARRECRKLTRHLEDVRLEREKLLKSS